MPNTKPTAIAILTFRRLRALQEMLNGLAANCPDYRIGIFEDCGLRDGTSAFLARGPAIDRDDLLATKHQFAYNIDAFLGKRNLGVSGNSNRAIKWFLDETDCEHLCLCNDDLHVLGNFAALYHRAHRDLGCEFFCFNDFWDSPSHRWIIARCRGYRLKVFPRMTGIMISTLRKTVNEVGYFDTRFGKFGEEHCTTGDTLVWMGDYTFKPISEIKVGESVIGWQQREEPVQRPDALNKASWTTRELCRSIVEKVGTHTAPVVRVLFESGASVTCTEDHAWALFYDHKTGYKYGFPELGRVLTKVVTPQQWPVDDDYRKGYVKGALDGDGSYRENEVVLRVQNADFTSKFRTFLTALGVVFSEKYDEGTGLLITRLLGNPKTFDFWKNWEPVTTSAWRGWLGGVYDAEGSGRTIGQSQSVNPDVCAKIYRGLDLFGFEHYTQEHQICIKGGRSELLRFWCLARPVCHYKIDAKMLTGRFKKPDKIIGLLHLEPTAVYGLKTTSGNYIAGGYASKNCDWNNRMRAAKKIQLDGLDQPCLDVEPALPDGSAGPALLRHQNVPSSLDGEERKREDAIAIERIRQAAERYTSEHYYRPFSLVWPTHIGGLATTGIKRADVPGYQAVVSS